MSYIDSSANRVLIEKFNELSEFANSSSAKIKNLNIYHALAISMISRIDDFITGVNNTIENEIAFEQRRKILNEIKSIITTTESGEDSSYQLIMKCLNRLIELGYIKINNEKNINE